MLEKNNVQYRTILFTIHTALTTVWRKTKYCRKSVEPQPRLLSAILSRRCVCCPCAIAIHLEKFEDTKGVVWNLLLFVRLSTCISVSATNLVDFCSVGNPQVHKASPGVLLVMGIFLLSMPDGSCMSLKCGRYLALPLHRSTTGVVWFSLLCSDVGWVCYVLSSV